MRSMESAEEVVLCMNKSVAGNVRLAAYTRPPKKPTQTEGHASVSMGALGVAALQQDVTNPEATISKREGTREEDTTGSPTNIGEPAQGGIRE